MARPDGHPRCTGTKANGDPCTANALKGTDPPRCGRHPHEGRTLQQRQKQARQSAFLEAFALVGNLSDAATAAQVDRSQHYRWLDEPGDPDVPGSSYADRFREATEIAADRLERAAVARAVNGVKRTVYYQGKAVGEETHYSDTLLMFLLNGRRPEVYKRERIVAGAGFDAAGRPFAAVTVDEHHEALAEAFTSYRAALEAGAPDDAIEVESTEVEG